jgi:hypothetical protein
MSWVREYLTMGSALAAGDRILDGIRGAVREALATAWQKRDAAEALVARGLYAEAIRLGVESATHLQRAATHLRDAGLLADADLQRRVADVERLAKPLAESSPAPLDAHVPQEQRVALEHLLRAELSLEAPLGERVLDRRGLLKLRWRRRLLAALILVAPACLVTFVRHSVFGVDARASSALDEEYAADRTLDGDPDTEWVPNGGGDEWLELRFHRRDVHTVRLLNGDLLPDRAAHEVKFEFYLDNELRSSGHKSFGAAYPPEWLSFDAGGVRCDRIRILITTHFGSGGALAEAQVE